MRYYLPATFMNKSIKASMLLTFVCLMLLTFSKGFADDGGPGRGGLSGVATCPQDPTNFYRMPSDQVTLTCPESFVTVIVEGDQGSGEWVIYLGDISDGIEVGRSTSDTIDIRLGAFGDTVYTAVGEGLGCTTTNERTLVILTDDTIAPTLDSAKLSDVVALGSLTVPSGMDAPTASDNCEATIYGDSDDAGVTFTNSSSENDTIHVVWTFEDGSGNSVTQDQNFIIEPDTSTTSGSTSYSIQDTICSGDSVAFDGGYVQTAGTYVDTIAVTGGDSIVSLTLTVIDPIVVPTIEEFNNFAILLRIDEVSGATYQWLDCNNGNAPLTGETISIYANPVSGKYAVEITHECGVDTTACYDFVENSVEELSRGTFSIAPNPVKDQLTLTVNNGFIGNNMSIMIYNALGTVVMEKEIELTMNNEYIVDMSDVKIGVYYMALSNGQANVSVQRFMVTE